VQRRTNPADGRSLFVVLTDEGMARLRRAQVTHHAVVRELLFVQLDDRDIGRLSELWEKAMPGSVSSRIWPPETATTKAALP
jgi:DNA-binding MarR family transcriptional regulator